MRVGFIATRLAGTDGVTLEVEKWAHVLRRMGHEVCFCAGELDGYAAGGALIPKLHFSHPEIRGLTRQAFETEDPDREALVEDINTSAHTLREPLRDFIQSRQLDLLIIQNALAIPMNLPLGVCLAELIADLGIPTIAHNHDYFWERERYQSSSLTALLDQAFPPDLPNIRHVSISSIAQKRLKARRGIESAVIPNVFDFERSLPDPDGYSLDLREALALPISAPFVLQPTRVVPRKGIEIALMLVQLLELEDPVLFITHTASDESLRYWHWLKQEAEALGVRLQQVEHLVHMERKPDAGRKRYTLWDIYPHADLITYPSLYEGFGNALLEAVYFKKPVVVNRYPVYNADIRPLGFEFIELDGYLNDQAAARARRALDAPQEMRAVTEWNFAIAREHFSLEVLERALEDLFTTL